MSVAAVGAYSRGMEEGLITLSNTVGMMSLSADCILSFLQWEKPRCFFLSVTGWFKLWILWACWLFGGSDCSFLCPGSKASVLPVTLFESDIYIPSLAYVFASVPINYKIYWYCVFYLKLACAIMSTTMPVYLEITFQTTKVPLKHLTCTMEKKETSETKVVDK